MASVHQILHCSMEFAEKSLKDFPATRIGIYHQNERRNNSRLNRKFRIVKQEDICGIHSLGAIILNFILPYKAIVDEGK